MLSGRIRCMTTGTEMLGQQELMEPPQRRRLQVAPGHTAIWGVDPSTRRIAIAGVGIEHRDVITREFAPLDGAQRLSHIYEQTKDLVGALANHGYWSPRPGLVVIESRGGKHENPALSYAYGVIQAAIYDGLYVKGAPVRIEEIAPSKWKKIACGRGNIYKPKRGSSEEYGVLSWARMNGYTGSSWDEADAWGIAEAARREVALVERC
jgi:hypothetical protein